MIEKPLTLLLLSRSAGGKGTQAKLLVEYFDVDLRITTGDLFRVLAKEQTVMGRKVAAILEGGGLFDDWLAISVWLEALRKRLKSPEQGIVFDGLARRPTEAQLLDRVMEWFGRAVVPILLDITPEESAKRMRARARSQYDFDEENIRRKQQWYEEEVTQSLRYYEKQGRLLKVDGMPPPDQVFQNVLGALGEKNSTN